jgi:hypothetical protein
VVTATRFLDIQAAFRAWLRANTLDHCQGLLVFCLLCLVTTALAVRFPRTATRQARLVLAVWTSDHLLAMLLQFAVVDGEVQAAIWR